MLNFIADCIRWIVVFLTDFLPVKIIRDDRGVPFLYRYHLFTLGFDGPGLCIHHFVKSDPERGYHDHPWSNAVSFILCGGYEERILKNNRVDYNVYNRSRWTFNYLDGTNNFHRVMIPEGKDAWTIFAFRGRSKTWGMINLNGDYYPMSTQISDTDGGWWNTVGNGYSIHNHVDHPGKVIATVDIIVLAECDKDSAKVLLIKRGKDPYKDCWAFPGGRIEQKDSDILAAAVRELKEETSLELPLEYVETIGNSTRDPRGFCLTNIFIAKLDQVLDGVKAGDDAVDYEWFSLDDLPTMAFDHKEILNRTVKVE